jgi:hypothetical protein
MGAAVEIALAAFALVWLLSFWYRTDGLRERLGVRFEHREREGYAERVDDGGLGGWLNCPQCAAFLSAPVALALWAWLPTALHGLAGLGGALLLVRWWEGARVKAEWWR